jgi:hypothetical protein
VQIATCLVVRRNPCSLLQGVGAASTEETRFWW